jgi:hypothetical protein
MDLSRSEPNLYIKGKNKFATFSGALLNFFAFAGIFAICLKLFMDFFDGDHFSLIYSEINDYDKQIDFSDIPMMFTVTSQRGGFMNSSIAYFSVQYVNMSNSIIEFMPLKYEKCDINKHFGKYKNLFEAVDVSNYNCIKPG